MEHIKWTAVHETLGLPRSEWAELTVAESEELYQVSDAVLEAWREKWEASRGR